MGMYQFIKHSYIERKLSGFGFFISGIKEKRLSCVLFETKWMQKYYLSKENTLESIKLSEDKVLSDEFLSSRALCIYFIVSDKINRMLSIYGKVIWETSAIDKLFLL